MTIVNDTNLPAKFVIIVGEPETEDHETEAEEQGFVLVSPPVSMKNAEEANDLIRTAIGRSPMPS